MLAARLPTEDYISRCEMLEAVFGKHSQRLEDQAFFSVFYSKQPQRLKSSSDNILQLLTWSPVYTRLFVRILRESTL